MLDSEEPIYQFYTIVNDPSDLVLENQDIQNLYEVGEEDGQDTRVVYIALQQDEAEEGRDEEEAENQTDIMFNEAENEPLSQSVSNIKLTFENGQVYLHADGSPDDNLTAVQPHLLNNITEGTEEPTSMDDLQFESAEEPVEETTEDDSSSMREIQLQDGTRAIINATLWNSLVENTSNLEKPPVSKKKFPCMYVGCEKAFTTSHHLSVHVRSHTGNRPYICSIEGCDKAFVTGYSLKAHQRTHTGEKPYGCDVCLKRFKTSGDLQKHHRTHTGEKPFKCPIEGCDRSFTTSNIRKVHIRSHTGERPYTCKVVDCGKAFASATNYKNHMRIHSGEKPYLCRVDGCGKRFTEYSSLYKHSVVHQPYRNFRCDYCEQFFKSENTLKLHKKLAHSVFRTENGTELMLSEEDSEPIVLEMSDLDNGHSTSDPLLVTSDNSNEYDDDL